MASADDTPQPAPAPSLEERQAAALAEVESERARITGERQANDHAPPGTAAMLGRTKR